MKPTIVALALTISLAGPVLLYGQIPATQRAGNNLPAGQTAAPNTPGGAVVVGANLYTGDGAQGFRHFKPADPNNADPVNSGVLVFDSELGLSLGGGGLCLPFCQVGQIAFDGSQNVYFPAYDHLKGNGATMPGVYRVTIDPVSGFIGEVIQLVPTAGLAGNNPTAIALGPDGNLYVGFLKNSNVVRITNPGAVPVAGPQKIQVVQAVGTAPNGRPVRSMVFAGGDLYLGTASGLAVIRNATAASCQGSCNGVPVADGFNGVDHVGLTSDGINRLYESINGFGVFRYTISTGATVPVSTGGLDAHSGVLVPFAFVGGHSNLLQLDRLGNLWIGDDPSDGRFNFSGRIWYIPAGALSNLP